MKLQGQTAIITGGGTGIGLACANLFIREGARVALFGRRRELLNQTAADLGKNVLTIGGDITQKNDVQMLVQKTVEAFGRIDILINNAGVFHGSSFHEMEEEQWDNIFGVNLRGVFLLTREVIPNMLEAGKGNIVNISSILGIVAARDVSAYNVSKGALNQLTRSIAVEYGNRGIRCNAVCPGLVATEMTSDIISNKELMEDWLKNYPIGRFGVPEDVARACLFLASTESSFITGAVLPVDGGYTAFAKG